MALISDFDSNRDLDLLRKMLLFLGYSNEEVKTKTDKFILDLNKTYLYELMLNMEESVQKDFLAKIGQTGVNSQEVSSQLSGIFPPGDARLEKALERAMESTYQQFWTSLNLTEDQKKNIQKMLIAEIQSDPDLAALKDKIKGNQG